RSRSRSARTSISVFPSRPDPSRRRSQATAQHVANGGELLQPPSGWRPRSPPAQLQPAPPFVAVSAPGGGLGPRCIPGRRHCFAPDLRAVALPAPPHRKYGRVPLLCSPLQLLPALCSPLQLWPDCISSSTGDCCMAQVYTDQRGQKNLVSRVQGL
ncbi:unnamed protein product, partial [Urochloa humidicola]